MAKHIPSLKIGQVNDTLQSTSAILEVNSTTQGILPPRMTSAQKNAITKVEGLVVYDTDLDTLCQTNGTVWDSIETANKITSTGINYTVLVTDKTVIQTVSSTTVTLPTAVGISAKVFTIKNASAGDITINTTSSQTIDGQLTQILSTYNSINVLSDGSNYYII
jgi:hypothetical protein